MKTIILAFLLSFSGQLRAQSSEFPKLGRRLVFEGITDFVFQQRDGLIRAPRAPEDFTFRLISPERLLVEGESYSELDRRIIGYRCEVEILGRGVIESVYDFQVVDCQLAF